MKLKIYLYIGFLVLFAVTFSQIAFPLSSRVKSINIINADRTSHLFEYEVTVESTRLVPIHILGNSVFVSEEHKNRIISKRTEPYELKVHTAKPSAKIIRLLVNTEGMSQDEIREMAENVDIRINWSTVQGWERENKTFIASDKSR